MHFAPRLAALLAAATLCAQAPPTTLQTAARELLQRHAETARVPGLSCAIGIDGQQLAFGVGHSDVENGVAASADTVYRLASISKPITATCVLLLCERHQLDLDADIRTYVPEFPPKPWPVTARQLLSHTAGIRHYRRGETESTVHFKTQRQGLARFAADPLLHQPGTAYRYSTYGYCLLAAAVEAVLQQPFPDCVHALIAAPCQAATLQDDDLRRLIPHRAQGYVRNAEGRLENSELMDASYKFGGGGLCSSAADLLRFGEALRRGQLLQPATLQRMWTPAQTQDGKALRYGLGFSIGSHDGQREIWHSGAQSRVSTMLYLLPEQHVTVVVLANLEGERLLPLARQLAALAAAPR